MITRIAVVVLLFVTYSAIANDEEQVAYAPSKVVYDISSPDPTELEHILDRASMLQNIYQNDSFEASIVFVVHEGAIPLFGNKVGNKDGNRYAEIMRRARSLSMGEVIRFRICKASADMQGYKKADLQDFISMVPMADAEIVRLQQEGYAYLR